MTRFVLYKLGALMAQIMTVNSALRRRIVTLKGGGQLVTVNFLRRVDFLGYDEAFRCLLLTVCLGFFGLKT